MPKLLLYYKELDNAIRINLKDKEAAEKLVAEIKEQQLFSARHEHKQYWCISKEHGIGINLSALAAFEITDE